MYDKQQDISSEQQLKLLKISLKNHLWLFGFPSSTTCITSIIIIFCVYIIEQSSILLTEYYGEKTSIDREKLVYNLQLCFIHLYGN